MKHKLFSYRHHLPGLSAPVFEDEEKTRIARLLNIIVIVTGGILLIDTVLNFTVLKDDHTVFVWLDLAGFVIFWIARRLMGQGKIRLASALVCITLWLGATASAYLNGGMLDPYFIVYLAVIVDAGLLLGGAAAIGFAILSVIVGVISLGNLPVPVYHDLRHLDTTWDITQIWIVHSLVFVMTALLLHLANRSITHALAHARKTERALIENNQRMECEINERRHAEAALRESQERYRLLVEMTPAAVMACDTSGEIRFTNPAAAALFGAQQADDLIGLNIWDYVEPESREALQDHIQQLEENVPGQTAEYRLFRLDREMLDAEIRPVQISYESKPTTLAVIRDITDSKQAQQERMRIKLMRVELEKEKRLLHLKESFIGMASHEFRTPLSVILASKNILEKYHSRLTPDKRHEQLDKIDKQVKFMIEMLDELLVLSKGNAGMLEFQLEPINMEHLCRSAVEEFESANGSQHRVDFESTLTPDSRTFLGDETLLRSILQNLLSNAAKYSPDGSTISVKMAYDRQDVVLTISDSGIGIPTQEQQHLFEPFYRASNARVFKGTGLGLAIVKNNVIMHNGTIICASEEGIGTTFTIRLPFHAET